MTHPLDRPLEAVAAALRAGECSATELVEEAIARHEAHGEWLGAYRSFDAEGARRSARRADSLLEDPDTAPALCGIPFSIKDLYGTRDQATFAGTTRELPERWRRDAWLVARMREQGAVPVGKTHTVELAFGGVGMNPHWGTPRNPWDTQVHRIPGGSSSGAGVSLHEGSALVALGTDTGGSIRIPAAMTGVVGHKTSYGLWPTDGVVPLSRSLDTVGALTRTAADALYFFDAVEGRLEETRPAPATVGLPDCEIWRKCQPDIARVLDEALTKLEESGARLVELPGSLLDEAADLYLRGGIAGAECRAFLERELGDWVELLDPIVGERIRRSPSIQSEQYHESVSRRRKLMARTAELFPEVDLVALPGNIITPPPVAELDDLERYIKVNLATLTPTCPVNLLGLCALTLPVGLDEAGMPVGLQLAAPGGHDRRLLEAGVWVERQIEGPGLPPTDSAPGPADPDG